MKRIETLMVRATLDNKAFHCANTAFDPRTQTVYLYGHPIACRAAPGRPWSFNLCGYNTVTTRSRICALGGFVRSTAGHPHALGRPVPLNGWWTPGFALEPETSPLLRANGYV